MHVAVHSAAPSILGEEAAANGRGNANSALKDVRLAIPQREVVAAVVSVRGAAVVL